MIRFLPDRVHDAVIACVALVLPVLTLADSPGMRVHRFERWQPSISHDNVNRVSNLTFSAYGRQFRMHLQPNMRLAAAASGSALKLYRGSLDGEAGSWVRLSVNGTTMRGMFWDGSDLYLVESARVADANLAGDETVLFRLTDTELDPPFAPIDETVMAPLDGQQAYTSLMNELIGAAPLMQAAVVTARLEISALGDAAFRDQFASDQQAQDAVLTRLNNVDGIFSSQVGIEIDVASVNIGDALTASLSATTVPSTLLNELATLRQQTSVLNTRGLTHLFTGRALDGNTVGIAFTRSLCSRTYSTSLTETHTSTALDSLVAAHEIGHVFGAPHDGEGACASTPPTQYIMAPSLSTSVTSFSQCSLDSMLPQVQAATCLMPLTLPDLSLPASLGSQSATVNTDSTWQITVSNDGGRAATGARSTVQITPDLTIVSATTEGGTCSIQTSLVTCDLAPVGAGGTQTIQVALRSPTAGTFSIHAQVVVADDTSSTNNSGDGTLTVTAAPTSPSIPAPAPVDRGGGGSPSSILLFALGIFALRRRYPTPERPRRGGQGQRPDPAFPIASAR